MFLFLKISNNCVDSSVKDASQHISVTHTIKTGQNNKDNDEGFGHQAYILFIRPNP